MISLDKGIFISFEGNDGSGKSTAVRGVYDELVKRGYDVVVTREPGGSKIAEDIRNVILDVNNTNMDSITEAMLYAASRRQHLVEKVIPYTEKGYIVLCDRFIDSSLAYQGHARGLGIEKVYQMNLMATNGLLPDVTIYIDVKPEVGLSRIKSNNREQNRLDLEKITFHEKVYEGYHLVSEMFKDRFKVINGEQERECVLNDTLETLNNIIK
jgi:dTMP kinase